jgi:hypothetical protein
MSQSIRTGDVNELSFINPKGLYDPAPNGYSHLAVFPAEWRIILPAGQGGETEDQVLSDDFRTQLKQALRNTEIVLAEAGAKLSVQLRLNKINQLAAKIARSPPFTVEDRFESVRPTYSDPASAKAVCGLRS